MVSGSSAGGYLALTTTAIVKTKPAAALLVYGMLDPAGPRYTSPGPNIFGKPAIDAEAILREHPLAHGKGETRQVLSAVTVSDPAVEKRFAIAEALHLKGLFVDYLTGVSGLGQVIREHGVGAIPNEHARLFPLSSGDLSSFPRTMLLHGKNDSAVPAENSTVAAEKLRSAGVSVLAEFPEDAEHGFDVRPGNINVEASDASDITAADALRKAIRFLDDSVKNS
jgi:acetyl esterase/lipase